MVWFGNQLRLPTTYYRFRLFLRISVTIKVLTVVELLCVVEEFMWLLHFNFYTT